MNGGKKVTKTEVLDAFESFNQSHIVKAAPENVVNYIMGMDVIDCQLPTTKVEGL